MVVRKRDELLEEEAFMISNAGELPEVAYFTSLYHLTEDHEGPGLMLDANDLASLKDAVVKSYRKIILRDLNPENRDKSIYRGIERAVVNWERLSRFALREKIDLNEIKHEVSKRLTAFLGRELEDISAGTQPSSINCKYEVIVNFASQVCISEDNLLKKLKDICLP